MFSERSMLLSLVLFALVGLPHGVQAVGSGSACPPVNLVAGTIDAIPAASQVQAQGALVSWARERLPYTVPEGKYLALTDVVLSSKYPGNAGKARSGYFGLDGILSVPEHVGALHFRTPIILPPGTRLEAWFINNSDEAQQMYAVVTGFLSARYDLDGCTG